MVAFGCANISKWSKWIVRFASVCVRRLQVLVVMPIRYISTARPNALFEYYSMRMCALCVQHKRFLCGLMYLKEFVPCIHIHRCGTKQIEIDRTDLQNGLENICAWGMHTHIVRHRIASLCAKNTARIPVLSPQTARLQRAPQIFHIVANKHLREHRHSWQL